MRKIYAPVGNASARERERSTNGISTDGIENRRMHPSKKVAFATQNYKDVENQKSRHKYTMPGLIN